MIKRILKKIGLFTVVRKQFVKLGLVEDKIILYKIGKNARNNSDMDTLIPQMVEIGDNFVSAPGSVITAHDSSTFNHTGKHRIERVIIGNNVYLGSNSVVLPGVNIGDNVIVGAGAIVTKDIPSNKVVVGNPARILCSVEDYLNKCRERKILYDAPNIFLEKKDKGIPLEKPKDIIEFQEFIMKQVKERDKNN